MLDRLNIGGRLAAGFGLLIFLILCLGAGLIYAARVGDFAVETVIRKQNNAMLDHIAQRSINDYGARRWRALATGAAGDLDRARAQGATVAKDIETLAASILDPGRRAQAQALGGLVADYDARADGLAEAASQSGNLQSEAARAAILALDQSGRALGDAAETLARTITRTAVEAQDDARGRLALLSQASVLLGLFSLGCSLRIFCFIDPH